MNIATALFPLPIYLWQVALHSWVMAVVFYAWMRRTRTPSGLTRRRLVALILLLPFVTAAIPGREGADFGERIAWFSSARVLAIPIGDRFHVADVVLLIFALSILVTVWQELLPSHRRPRTIADAPPESLVTMARSFPGWSSCRVRLSPSDSIVVVTGRWPWRPALIVSKGALAALTPAELELAIAHENAHAHAWLETHALVLVRLIQSYNPVAIWAFRAYCFEVEVACDARASIGRDPQELARVVLKIYQSTDRTDRARRTTLRKRVDVLLAGGPNDKAFPVATILIAAVVMLVVLPWIV